MTRARNGFRLYLVKKILSGVQQSRWVLVQTRGGDKTMSARVMELLRSKKAQGMTEYILIVALIALLAVVGVRMFGGTISKLFQDKAKEIEEAK